MAPEGSKSLGPAVSPGSAYLQQLEGRGPCDESWPSPGPTVIRGSSPSSPSTGSQRRKPCPGCLPHVSNTVSLDPAPPDSAPEIPSGYLTRRTTLQLRVKGSQGTITWKSPSHVLTLTQEKFDLLSLASVSFTCKIIKNSLFATDFLGKSFKVVCIQFSSFSRSVVSDSLQPHEPQYARPPCPSPTPGVHWNPCPLSRSCHPTISSSVVPFSSCPQSFPASASFPIS